MASFTEQIARRKRALSNRTMPGQGDLTSTGQKTFTSMLPDTALSLRERRRGSVIQGGVKTATLPQGQTAIASTRAGLKVGQRMAEEKATELEERRKQQEQQYKEQIEAQRKAHEDAMRKLQEDYDKRAESIPSQPTQPAAQPKPRTNEDKLRDRYSNYPGAFDTYGKFVQKAYQKYLGRDPDIGGWQSFTDHLVSGGHWQDVIRGILLSPEAQTKRSIEHNSRLFNALVRNWHERRSNYGRQQDAWFGVDQWGNPV